MEIGNPFDLFNKSKSRKSSNKQTISDQEHKFDYVRKPINTNGEYLKDDIKHMITEILNKQTKSTNVKDLYSANNNNNDNTDKDEVVVSGDSTVDSKNNNTNSMTNHINNTKNNYIRKNNKNYRLAYGHENADSFEGLPISKSRSFVKNSLQSNVDSAPVLSTIHENDDENEQMPVDYLYDEFTNSSHETSSTKNSSAKNMVHAGFSRDAAIQKNVASSVISNDAQNLKFGVARENIVIDNNQPQSINQIYEQINSDPSISEQNQQQPYGNSNNNIIDNTLTNDSFQCIPDSNAKNPNDQMQKIKAALKITNKKLEQSLKNEKNGKNYKTLLNTKRILHNIRNPMIGIVGGISLFVFNQSYRNFACMIINNSPMFISSIIYSAAQSIASTIL